MKKIIVLTALFAMVFTGAAIAADWSFYGSARVRSWWFNDSKERATTPTADSMTFLDFDGQSNTRIGARAEAGDIKGRFEYGHSSASSTTGTGLRILYGRWNFGGGELAVGQYYTPAYYGFGNQAVSNDTGMAGWGATAAGRAPMVRLKFGGFSIAAVKTNPTTYAGYTLDSTVLPKIEGAYEGNFGPVALHVSAGYQNASATSTANDSVDTTSFIGQVFVKYGAGPFEIGGAFNYGSNYGNYFGAGNTADVATLSGTEVKDATTWQGALYAGFKVNDMVGLEAGFGMVNTSPDSSVSSNDDTALAYYLQVPLTLADGVLIVPEFGKFDWDENSAKVKEGDRTYFGAKFQINF